MCLPAAEVQDHARFYSSSPSGSMGGLFHFELDLFDCFLFFPLRKPYLYLGIAILKLRS